MLREAAAAETNKDATETFALGFEALQDSITASLLCGPLKAIAIAALRSSAD